MEGQMSMFDDCEKAAVKEVKSVMKLYNEDCLDVLKDIPDNSIDIVVTDCPYHIVSGGCSNNAVKIGQNCGGILRKDNHGNAVNPRNNHTSLVGMFDDRDPTTYTKQGKLFKYNEIKFSEWVPEVYRVLKPGTHCYIMINPRNLKALQQECENAGFVFQNLLVWDKGNATPNKYYMNAYEVILMLRKGNAKNINNMGSKNIIRVPNIMRSKKHPTEKPVDLMKVFIENSSNEGDTVLEPFMGAGSTGVAAKMLGRNFIGIEIDEVYFNIAAERIEGELNV